MLVSLFDSSLPPDSAKIAMQHQLADNIRINTCLSLSNRGVYTDILRLDELHPVISGNKWFKLRYYLEEAQESGAKEIITFGGPYSNHVAATAFACKLAGLSAHAYIRTYQPIRTPTLITAEELGMQISFHDPMNYAELKKSYPLQPHQYIIPEGGYGTLGVQGAATIWQHIPQNTYSHIICMVGSGTTLAGLIQAAPDQTQVIGISSMKNNIALQAEIATQLPINLHHRIQLIHDYHFGGFAKHTTTLLAFMQQLWEIEQIPSDIVYTAKLFYAVNDLIQNDFFPPASKLLLIHTGGLQGNASLPTGTLPF
jgi:1-aminocyclopropane-1-carboxylate deaminase